MSGAFTALDGPGAQAPVQRSLINDRTQAPTGQKKSKWRKILASRKDTATVISNTTLIQAVRGLFDRVKPGGDRDVLLPHSYDDAFQEWEKYFSEKELTVLYTILSFTVARQQSAVSGEKNKTEELFSPFWEYTDAKRKTVRITEVAKFLAGNSPVIYYTQANGVPVTRPDTDEFDVPEPLPTLKYSAKTAEFRTFCDLTFQIMLQFLGQNRVATFILASIKREGALAIRRTDTTGTTLKFGLVRPIIGRYLNKDFFVKQRAVGMSKTQAAYAALGAPIRLFTTLYGIVSGATDSEKQVEFVQNTVSFVASTVSDTEAFRKSEPVFNDMRAFLVRSKDVVAMLSSIADEVLRQQRDNEVKLRRLKRQLRERFDRPEDAQEAEALAKKTTSKAISMNLLNEVMDVSANISVAYYLIWKYWSDITGEVTPNAKGEAMEEGRDEPGEADLIAEMLAIVTGGSESSWLARALRWTAEESGNAEYFEKVTNAFRAYEQDLRDGIQDVQLALSAYRLRVEAENALYDALRQPNAAEKLGGVNFSLKDDRISVDELPKYEDLLRDERKRAASRGPPPLADALEKAVVRPEAIRRGIRLNNL